VLSLDPFSIPAERLAEVRCDMTFVDGECVFERA
jgi:predicted amidohydrolase YtcJ